MAKNIQPTSIPINAKLSLAEVDDIVHSLDTPAFADKNSITYQGLIRNAHITEDDGYLTTNGRFLKKEQLKDSSGNNIGTTLIDDLGKKYEVKHNWLLKKSYPLKNFSGGSIISSTIYNNNIYELYKDQDIFSILVLDLEQKNVKTFKQLDCISATIGSRFQTENAPTLWLLKSITKKDTKWVNVIESVDLVEGAEVKTFTKELDIPLGKELTATDLGTKKIVGFEDIDQERRYSFKWDSSKPKELKGIRYFGTVAPNGMITGEPIPYLKVKDENIIELNKTNGFLKRLGNGVLAWDIKGAMNSATIPSGKALQYALQVGYLPNGEPAITKYWDNDVNIKTPKYWITVNISTNDVNKEFTGEDPRSKPKDFFISNFADSKGVYYEYGQGWARTYYRVCEYGAPKVTDLGIFTAGATAGFDESDGKSWQRHETLMAKGKVATWDYTNEHLNERVYTLGGNNKDEYSLLGAIPFTVDLLYQGTEEKSDIDNIDVFKSQVYGLVETSYSFLQTLLTTPSEVKGDIPINLTWVKGKSLIVFANGEIYEVIKSSDYKDLRLDKVADYAFRLNVMDGKNALKEDRDGNISLVRAFIPYNMECVIRVKDLKLTPPLSDNAKGKPEDDARLMIKDSNDSWYEGVGKNVNLLVEDISMSFLSPMIRLPLWEKEEEFDQFRIESIEHRNSIIKPVLRGCFLEGESVDVYYTLQKDSQDCTYKSTQTIRTDEEAIANGWQKYGKSSYDVLKKGYSWWLDASGTVIFPIGIGSTIDGINFITPSVQLPQSYSSRLYTYNNQLFLGFNYISQIWHGATIFTIYGQNYYFDQQGIYFLGADNDFTNNNFVTYALGMRYLANSGSEAYFYSDFEKRLYVFTGSNTLQPADLLSSINGDIIDAAFSSKEQTLYLLTSEGRILVRTMTDLCQLKDYNVLNGHLEGTTEGAAIVGERIDKTTGEVIPTYKIFSPYKGEKVLPFALRTEHFGSMDFLFKCGYIDVTLYKMDENPTVLFTCQTLNGIEKESEKITIRIKPEDWKGNQYRFRLTPKLNTGNAFDIGIYSKDEIGVQNITFYNIPLWTGQGDSWGNNVVNKTPSIRI